MSDPFVEACLPWKAARQRLVLSAFEGLRKESGSYVKCWTCYLGSRLEMGAVPSKRRFMHSNVHNGT